MAAKKIALVLGTRPEIIKLSAILRRLQKSGHPFVLIHTGQQSRHDMDKLFFKELDLPAPHYQFLTPPEKGELPRSHAMRMAEAVKGVLVKEKPSAVLVQGDTNSVLAGALAVKDLKADGEKMVLGHVEAGLRSYDLRMPEEHNRIETDRLSDFLFVPTKKAQEIVLKEGIAKEKVFLTGNTIVDAVHENLKIAFEKCDPSRWPSEPYFLLTLHRQENVDSRPVFGEILEALAKVAEHFKTKIIFPVHPRTRFRLDEFGLSLPSGIVEVPPMGFFEFLAYESRARLILTDSGGVQEEACIMRVPCVTMRLSTERPETVDVGGNVIAGVRSEGILTGVTKMLKAENSWENPFGDGRASEKILNILDGPSPA